MKRILIFVVISFLAFSCASHPNNDSSISHPFPKVTIPSFIDTEAGCYEYLALHYWDRFMDSSLVYSQDTSLVGGVKREDFNNAYLEYITILQNVSVSCFLSAQDKAVHKAEILKTEHPENTVFDYFIKISEHVLYGANSDYRNEEMFIPILETLSSSVLVNPLSRIKYQQLLSDCCLNRLGTPATDFKYTTSNGKNGSLYKISSPYTLLFFSNPGCNECLLTIDALNDSEQVQRLIATGKLTILNIYIDPDIAEWMKYSSQYPKDWINAYDAESTVRNSHLYNVRAIPSLYLLDKKKNVICKDDTLPSILHHLNYL